MHVNDYVILLPALGEVHKSTGTILKIVGVADMHESQILQDQAAKKGGLNKSLAFNRIDLHIWYAGRTSFTQSLPIGSEAGARIDQRTILFQPLCDVLLPFQAPNGCGVQGGQQSQV